MFAGRLLLAPRRANAVPDEISRGDGICPRGERRTGRRDRTGKRAMPVRPDGANRRPTIVELIWKQKRRRPARLIDPFISRRGSAAEENLVPRRTWNGVPGDHPLLPARCLVATRERGRRRGSVGE